jgi:hypothetical protein
VFTYTMQVANLSVTHLLVHISSYVYMVPWAGWLCKCVLDVWQFEASIPAKIFLPPVLHVYVCMYKCVCVCVCVSVFVYKCVCMHNVYVCVWGWGFGGA